MTSPATSTNLSAPIDLQLVRRLFSRPERLAGSRFLRREIAARMLERLLLIRIAPQAIIDAGCGEGEDLPLLQKRFPAARLVGIDASPNMIDAARGRQSAALSSLNKWIVQWLPAGLQPGGGLKADLLCSDFSRSPLAGQSVDLIWSNLALHWHPAPDKVFAEWRRLLRVDGLLMFSCFGPDTLKELRAAFTASGLAPPVLPFVDMHDFGDMLVETGFATPVMDMETITVTYQSVDKLLAEVRALGGNPLATRRRGLTGRDAWDALKARLEQQRGPDGTIALTFEVIFGHAFRPAPKTIASGEAIIRFGPGGKR